MNAALLTSTDKKINANLIKFVDELFMRMRLDYQAKFTTGDEKITWDRLKLHWCESLVGYSNFELRRGVSKMKKLNWPPNIIEFKNLCRPPIDHTKAYYEAIEGLLARDRGDEGTWSHPAIFWAAMPISFDLKSNTFSYMKSRWEAALDAQIEKGEWEEIKKPCLSLDFKRDIEKSKRLCRKVCVEALGILGRHKVSLLNTSNLGS